MACLGGEGSPETDLWLPDGCGKGEKTLFCHSYGKALELRAGRATSLEPGAAALVIFQALTTSLTFPHLLGSY